MKLSAHERSILKQLAQDLRTRFEASDVRLFGSAARNELDPESDVDVFVVVPKLTWPTEQAICDRCYEATLSCGRLVTPCVFSADELAHTPLRCSPLVRTVRQESVVL